MGESRRDERQFDHESGGRCDPRDVDRLLARLAGRQYGVVARWQLLAAGVSRRVIDGRLGRRLHPIHRGVYAVGYQSDCTRSRWIAAVLMAGPDAVLSHRSAAQLWRFSPRSGHMIEVARPSRLSSHPHIRGYRSRLPRDERTVVNRIPVTTAPRTILDLAVVASRREVERALNEMEAQGVTDPLSIPNLLKRHHRRRGSALIRSLLADKAEGLGITRNDFEEDFVTLLDAHGLPRPRLNADILIGGRFFNADCLWADARLIVELDGRETHGAPRAFEDDRERDRLMLAEGWRVMRVTWRQLHMQEAAVAGDLRKALGHGRASHRPRDRGQM